MLKHGRHVQRLMFLFAIAGLFAVSADFACLDDVCAEGTSAKYTNLDDISKDRIRTLQETLTDQGIVLTPDQRQKLTTEGKLFAVVKLDRPVLHPNGEVEMPKGWLPKIPEGHVWSKSLTPADDAYYSFVEERIFRAKLFNPANPSHKQAADAYLAKAVSGEQFIGWTAEDRTECAKIKMDAAGTGVADAE
jgi:hypothetical protein